MSVRGTLDGSAYDLRRRIRTSMEDGSLVAIRTGVMWWWFVEGETDAGLEEAAFHVMLSARGGGTVYAFDPVTIQKFAPREEKIASFVRQIPNPLNVGYWFDERARWAIGITRDNDGLALLPWFGVVLASELFPSLVRLGDDDA